MKLKRGLYGMGAGITEDEAAQFNPNHDERGRFADTAGGGDVQAIARLDALPKAAPAWTTSRPKIADWVANPVPLTATNTREEVRNEARTVMSISERSLESVWGPNGVSPLQDVPVAALITNQNVISHTNTLQLLRPRGPGYRVPPPIHVIKDHGKYLIWDGNHRAAVALLRGEPTVRAEVFDLDARRRSAPTVNAAEPPAEFAHDPFYLAPWPGSIVEGVEAMQFNPNHDDRGRFAETDGAGSDVVDQPASAYPPAREGGLDTKERYTRPDGTYTPERRALHDALVAQRFNGKHPIPADQQTTVTVMGGGPASGKSVLLRQNLGLDDAVVSDADSFKEQLPEFKDMVAARNLAAGTFAHEETADLSKRIVREAVDGHYNLVVDGTGDHSYENLATKVAGYRRGGARVVGQYVSADVDEAIRRSFIRGQQTGRHVPEAYLRETHRSVSRVVEHAMLTGLFDELTIWDTNGPQAIKAASARGRTVTVHNQAAWDRFLAKGN